MASSSGCHPPPRLDKLLKLNLQHYATYAGKQTGGWCETIVRIVMFDLQVGAVFQIMPA